MKMQNVLKISEKNLLHSIAPTTITIVKCLPLAKMGKTFVVD